MKLKRVLAGCISAQLALGSLNVPVLALEGTNFIDVSDSDWFGPAVTFCYDRELMTGSPDEYHFSPTQNMSRGMLVTVLHRLEGSPEAPRSSFTDVIPNAWNAAAINWAANEGIINGYNSLHFGPSDNLTREQMAKIMKGYASYAGIDTTQSASLSRYSDMGRINPVMLDSVKWAVGAGLMGVGTSNLNPTDSIKRSEVAAIIDRFIEKPNTTLTVSFDTGNSSNIPSQIVNYGQNAVEPDELEREGYVFTGWVDEDGDDFNFDTPVVKNLKLSARWEETPTLSQEVLDDLKPEIKDPEYEDDLVSYDLDAPVSSIEIKYSGLNEEEIPLISPVEEGDMLGIVGLISQPVSITPTQGNVNKAEITFTIDSNSGLDLENVGIVWFDSENDQTILLEDATRDPQTNSISVKTDHFSCYALVDIAKFLKNWQEPLPAVRSDSKPYYNMIMAIDVSGSMNGSRNSLSAQAASHLVNALSPNDYLSVLIFDDSTKTVLPTTMVAQENKEEIGKTIYDGIYPHSGGGTNISGALSSGLEFLSADSQYQNLMLLLSDGGASVSDSLINDIASNGMKVVTVGIGSGTNTELMKRIADGTNGQYIQCNQADDLLQAFIDLQNAYLGSTTDSDQDGLPDLAETTGMRDQYGEIFRTDPYNSDSDGDGISDGEEMGNYDFLSKQAFFHRKSNPNIYTVNASTCYFSIPGDTASIDSYKGDKAKISFTVETISHKVMTDSDGQKREYYFSDPNNLKIEAEDSGETNFKVTKTDIGNSTKEGSHTTYPVTLEAKSNVKSIENLWLGVTASADNCQNEGPDKDLNHATGLIYKKLTLKTPQKITSSYGSLSNKVNLKDKTVLAETEKRILSGLNTDQSRTKGGSLDGLVEELSGLLEANGLTDEYLKEEICSVIGQAALQQISDTTIEEYKDKPNDLVKQIYNQLSGITKTINTTITVGRENYRVNGTLIGMSGIENAFLTVRCPNGKTYNIAWTNSSEARQALSEYVAALAKLNTKLWKNVIGEYIKDCVKVINIKNLTPDNVQTIFNIADPILKSLVHNDDAKSYLKDKFGETSDIYKELAKGFGSIFGNKLADLVKETLPHGKEIINAAKQYEKFVEQYNSFEKIYQSTNVSDKDGEEKIKKAYETLEGVYEVLDKTILTFA